MVNRFRGAALAGLVAAVVGVGVVSPSYGQMGDAAGFAELNLHDYLHRDIVLFQQALNLDEGQRVILESLYEDYRSAFDAGWQRTQQRLTDMREELQAADRDQVMNMVLAPFENWHREKQSIRERFEENVKVILNQQQIDRWPAFQRQMTREKTLHRGRLSGESVNLFHVLRELRLDNRTQRRVDAVMEQYDIALHEALERRNDAMQQSQRDMLRSVRNLEQGMNFERTQQQIQLRTAVRDVNDQYIEVIAASLPDAVGDEFRDSALERGYPRVFRPLPAQRLFEEAKGITGLDEDVLDAIISLESAMLSELVSINAQLHRGIREHEPKAMLNQAEIVAARQSGAEVSRLTDPNVVTFRHRDERAGYYVQQLRDLLGTEQFAALPGSTRWMPERRAQQTPADARSRPQPQRRQRPEASQAGEREEPRRGRADESLGTSPSRPSARDDTAP